MPAATAAFRAPKQARSRRTLSRIIQAATDLVAERGVDDITVQQIVARANSSVGSFYARFDGKEDLLDYLERRVWEDARAHWDAAVEDGGLDDLSLAELMPGIVRLLLESARHEATIRRALRSRQIRRGPSLAARDFHDHVQTGIHSLMLARRSEMVHPDPEGAVVIGLQVVLGGLRRLEEDSPDLEDDTRVAELSRLLLAYLGSELPGKGKTIDFFDVWA